MNHIQLHEALSEDFKNLRSGKLKPQQAREIFNGAGKLIANCKNELVSIHMGFSVDVPLLGIKKEDCNVAHKPASPKIEKTLKEIEERSKKPYKFSE